MKKGVGRPMARPPSLMAMVAASPARRNGTAPAIRDGAWRKLQRNWRHHSRTVYKSSAQGQSSPIAPLSNPCHGDRMIEDHVLFIDGEAIIFDKHDGLAVDPPKNGGLRRETHHTRPTFGLKRCHMDGPQHD